MRYITSLNSQWLQKYEPTNLKNKKISDFLKDGIFLVHMIKTVRLPQNFEFSAKFGMCQQFLGLRTHSAQLSAISFLFVMISKVGLTYFKGGKIQISMVDELYLLYEPGKYHL